MYFNVCLCFFAWYSYRNCKFCDRIGIKKYKSIIEKKDKKHNQFKPTSLNSSKSKVDKIKVDKLVPFSVDLSKLNVAKNDVVKKVVYYVKIKDIESRKRNVTELATNTTLNAKIIAVKIEIPYITKLATNTALNAKINEVKNKIPYITILATNTHLTVVENKLPNVSNLVKKLTITQKFMRTLLIMIIVISIFLLRNLIN